MNKTVTINLGGLVFHIDENAYDVLKKYIQSLKQHFATSDGGEEIIADIEARIGEMFSTRLKENRQVIELSDVEEVISKMGKPEEFAEATQQQSEKDSSYSFTNEIPVKKRLFRHPDDKILGGVCGGISAYFDIDPIWIRLAFAGAFFIMGWGFLLYIILWIVIPKVRTTAEKLQMRGEPVNVENIQRTIREEMDGVKERVKSFAGKASEAGRDGRVRTATHRVVNFIEELATAVGRVLGKILGVLMVIFSLILLGIFFSVFTGSFHFMSDGMFVNGQLQSVKELFFNNEGQYTLALISFILVVGLPLFMVLYKGARLLFGVKIRSRYIHITAMTLWLVGVLLAGYLYIDMSTSFKRKYTFRHSLPMLQPKGNTLFVEVNDSTLNNSFFVGYSLGTSGSSFNFNDGETGLTGLRNIQFDVMKGATDSFELIQVQSAHGHSQPEAIHYAQDIVYGYSQKDSVLQLDAVYTCGKENKFRMQRVRLILKVPVGKAVYLGEHTGHIISDIKNTTDTYDGDMPGHKWMMTAQGLTCVDCEEWKTRHKSHHHQRDDDEQDTE